MPIFLLKISAEGGIIDVSHYCCDKDAKPVFNTRALRRSKQIEYTAEEKEILNEALKAGAETVYKWKSKIPVYFIDPINFANQLKINRNTLLGKVLLEIKKEFESKEALVTEKAGIIGAHVGKPRVDVFQSALNYLEKSLALRC
jgi:hypothetical protein